MNTTFYKKPNLAIEKLKLSLSNNLKEMQEIRKTMSDIDFGKIYGVSATTISNYMGNNKKHSVTKKYINVEETNRLRMIYSDIKVSKIIDCGVDIIRKYCGTRKSNGIGKITKYEKKQCTKSIKLVKKPDIKFALKQDRWEYNVEIPYWDTSLEVQLYNGSHPALFSKLA